MQPHPRRTATWPRVNGRAGAREGKRTRLSSAPLRWSSFATRGVAARPHATRCTAISRPARGRSRTRCKASAACRRVVAGARAAESQRSEQLRAGTQRRPVLRASPSEGRKFGSRVPARNLSPSRILLYEKGVFDAPPSSTRRFSTRTHITLARRAHTVLDRAGRVDGVVVVPHA